MVFFQTASIRHIIGRQHSHIIRLRHYAVSVKLTVNALTAHMTGEQLDIQGKLKPVERRLTALKKHLEQSDIYFKCKGKKPLTEAEQILFTTAKDYLKGIMNGKTTIPTKTWKEEYTKLTAERKTLNQRYLALKEEVRLGISGKTARQVGAQ